MQRLTGRLGKLQQLAGLLIPTTVSPAARATDSRRCCRRAALRLRPVACCSCGWRAASCWRQWEGWAARRCCKRAAA